MLRVVRRAGSLFTQSLLEYMRRLSALVLVLMGVLGGAAEFSVATLAGQLGVKWRKRKRWRRHHTDNHQ